MPIAGDTQIRFAGDAFESAAARHDRKALQDGGEI
jgi:hypothetical protein